MTFIVWSVLFVLLGLSPAGARGFGLTDPGAGLYSDDIDGQTRSGSWDIGADQYVASSGSASLLTTWCG